MLDLFTVGLFIFNRVGSLNLLATQDCMMTSYAHARGRPQQTLIIIHHEEASKKRSTNRETLQCPPKKRFFLGGGLIYIRGGDKSCDPAAGTKFFWGGGGGGVRRFPPPPPKQWVYQELLPEISVIPPRTWARWDKRIPASPPPTPKKKWSRPHQRNILKCLLFHCVLMCLSLGIGWSCCCWVHKEEEEEDPKICPDSNEMGGTYIPQKGPLFFTSLHSSHLFCFFF